MNFIRSVLVGTDFQSLNKSKIFRTIICGQSRFAAIFVDVAKLVIGGRLIL